jgi:hypothetical protein
MSRENELFEYATSIAMNDWIRSHQELQRACRVALPTEKLTNFTLRSADKTMIGTKYIPCMARDRLIE